jgi:uncharacterized protein (TIGR04255 family)
MARPAHLNNAPIEEAIIDFRVKLRPNFDIGRLSSLKEALHDSYPNMEEVRGIHFALEMRAKQFQQALEDKGLAGYFFRSADMKNVAQFRQDGFTFSRLRPYTEWETVFAEATRLWHLYVAEASPELVTRVATRYINRMKIPLPIDDFADYLSAAPVVPSSLPQAVSQFMSRVVICDEERYIYANITQALLGNAKPNHVTIVLDIDVYGTREGHGWSIFEEKGMYATFEQLRELKNRVFFDSITEKTKRLFE